MTPETFIQKFQNEIIQSTNGTPLFPSVKMAQAALETGWGANFVNDANNMFGIKATGEHTPYWDGDSVNSATNEIYNGQITNINDNFRKYKTITDSVRDHSWLLMKLDRYLPVRKALSPEDQAKQLQVCGYATATNYANSLMQIINTHNLKKLDKKKMLMKYLKLSLAIAALTLVIWTIYENIKY